MKTTTTTAVNWVPIFIAAGLPAPVTEHRFALPDRAWAFDYAWPLHRVALEIEGGVWTRGRHVRGKGFTEDIRKYNHAVLLGWRLLRSTPDMLASGETLAALVKLLHQEGGG